MAHDLSAAMWMDINPIVQVGMELGWRAWGSAQTEHRQSRARYSETDQDS